MVEQRTVGPSEDPVCGMVVDALDARGKGLVLRHGDREYVFCGKGCLLEFGDDPERHLGTGYQPAM